MEGDFGDDDVFREDDAFELQDFIPRHESIAHELEQSTHRLLKELLKDKVESFYRSTGITPDFIDYNNWHELYS